MSCKRRPGGHLGQAVDVERHPEAVQVVHQFAGAEAVADAQARQPIGLGKGAQPHQGAVFRQIFQAGRHLGVIGKVNIGLIQDHGDGGGDRRQKVFPLLAVKRGAGGIVGVVQDDQPGLGSDRLGHGLQVHPHLFQRHRAENPAHGLGQEAVHQKGVGGAQHLAPRRHQGPDQQVQDFVGTVAQDQLRRRQAEMAGQVFLEVIGVAVGVAVQAPEGVPDGGQGQGRRPQGIFIGCQLDGIGESQFSFQFFQRFAGLVGRELGEVRQNERGKRDAGCHIK